MISSRFKLGRRNFLRGAGTAGLVLPFLESLPERSAFAQDEKPTFGFFICTSCGVVGKNFWPNQTGALTTAGLAGDTSKAVSVLADHADRLLLVRGVNYPGRGSGCSHADGLSKCLTAGDVSGASNLVVPSSVSCDTVIANGLGVQPLTLYAGLKGGYIDEKLSFSAPGTVRAAEGNPYNVYLDLAGLLDKETGEPTPMADQLAISRKSVNDLVRGDINSMMNSSRISAADKQRLQLHLDSIRDMENTMTGMDGMLAGCSSQNLDLDALKEIQTKSKENGRQEDVCKLHIELVALAFACNVTRVATLQAGDGTDATQYTINGEKYERFHHISHRINGDGVMGSTIQNAEQKHHNIDRLRLETFKFGIEKWSQYDTPAGPLLDNGFMYWTSHVADGPSHSFNNLPIIIAGNAGGYLKQGAYVDGGNSSNAKVLNTLITANGVPTQNFGTGGTGLLSQMLANG